MGEEYYHFAGGGSTILGGGWVLKGYIDTCKEMFSVLLKNEVQGAPPIFGLLSGGGGGGKHCV